MLRPQWYVLLLMKPHPRHWPIAALLLALLLPLQGFASIMVCPQLPTAHNRAHQAEPAHLHCREHAQQESSARHHGCGDCCMAAVAQAAPDWIAPRGETTQLSLPLLRAPLKISLDRLDRPPRAMPGTRFV